MVDFKTICNGYPLTFDHDINVKPTLQRFDKIDRIQCKWWIKTIMCKVQIEMLNLMKTTVHEVQLLFKFFHDFALSLRPGSTIDVLPCPCLCPAVERSHLSRSLGEILLKGFRQNFNN